MSGGRWLRLARVYEIGLLLVLLFVAGGCDDCGLDAVVWQGRVWKVGYYKLVGLKIPLIIFSPEGEPGFVRNAPFNLVPRDGGFQPVPLGAPGPSFNARAGYHVYLLGDSPDALYAFDQQSGGLAATVNLPVRPQKLAVSPDGLRVYVTHQAVEAGNPFFPQSPPRISVIGTATHTIVDTINLPADKVPGKPVVGPDSRFLYVPHAGTFVSPVGYQNASLLVVDTQTRAVAAEIPLNIAGATINHVAITPDGALVYGTATQSIPARIYVFDTAERELTATFVAPGSSRDLLVDYTGSRLYVLTQNSVIAYDTAVNEETGRLLVRQNARLNVIGQSPEGRSLFVNDEISNIVYRIDKRNLQIAGELNTGQGDPPPDVSWMVVIP
jgi:DNA-binding beta-propeller fold protein YncE